LVVLGVVSGGVTPGVLGVGLVCGVAASAKGAADRSSTAASVVSVLGNLM
jgi:hypothetical protein